MPDAYEFSYNTPTTAEDGTTILVPTTFRVGGIHLDVAKGIRFGLRRVIAPNATVPIQDVTARRVVESVTEVEP